MSRSHPPTRREVPSRERLTLTPQGSLTHLDSPARTARDGRLYKRVDDRRDVWRSRRQPALGAPSARRHRHPRSGSRSETSSWFETGYFSRALADQREDHYGGLGYHASTLPLLHQRGVAVIASDALNDMNPSGYAFDGPATPDSFARLGRWESMITIEPLRMVGSIGSHVNPLAIS
jgi:hypothetical protein